jgi:hypothetical protein
VAVVDRIKGATHDAKPVPFMRLGTALPGKACRARWQGHPVGLVSCIRSPMTVGVVQVDGCRRKATRGVDTQGRGGVP